MRDSYSRRGFLRRAALGTGALLAGPVLPHLCAEGLSPAASKRFVFVTVSNGLKLAGNGHARDRLIDLPLAGHELPFTLEPLEPFQDRLSIIQGLSGKICAGGHFTQCGALGVYPGSKGQVLGETIDCALGKTRPTIFPHVGLGVVDGSGQAVAYGRSATGGDHAAPTLCRPDLAYNHLFGSVAGAEAQQSLAARDNLLEFLSSDIQRLEEKLAGDEKQRLGSHVRAYQAMRDRRDRLNAYAGTLRKHAPTLTDKYTSDEPMERLDAQFEIGAAALISGLTDVLTISSGVGAQWNMSYRSLGIGLASHPIGHGQGEDGRSSNELAQIVRRYHVELIARLANKLKAVPEGNGSMFDNTVIVFLSDNANGHHSGCEEWPFVIVGNLGGALNTSGRYLEYPRYGQDGHHTIANLYTTFLRAAGVPLPGFGVPDPNLNPKLQKGPLPELIA